MADDLNARIGAALRAARLAKGMSQDQVAKRAGMSRSNVANLEAGRQGFPFPTLAAVTQLLCLDLAELVSLVKLPPQPPVPHNVVIRPVLEVSCSTCGGTVLEVTISREEARESRERHVAAAMEADRA